MMTSVFDAADNAALIDRIELLTPMSAPLWGKMNVAQMMAHCQVPIKLAVDELNIKGSVAGFLFGRIAKGRIINEKPFPINVPTFKQAKITGTKDFNYEREQLINLVNKLVNAQPLLTKRTHPFFGPLTVDEWDILQYKHLDHHLRQFGV